MERQCLAKTQLITRFIHYSHGSKMFCYVLYLNGFHGKKSEKNKFPPPPKKANYQSLQPANQQNNLSMKTDKCAMVKDVSNLITAFDKYLHIQQNCIHTMLFSK